MTHGWASFPELSGQEDPALEDDLPDCDGDKRITLRRGDQVSCGLCHENKLAEH